MKEVIFYFFYFFLLVTVNSIRLNVPRILLPYHPEVQSIFLLSVSNPEGHCFKWLVFIFKIFFNFNI